MLILYIRKIVDGTMRRFSLVIVNVGLAIGSVFGQADVTRDFEMPLKIKPVVSGSFGELRSNHFHSGVDLTTHGKTGYRVYCSDDGFVSRIKVSPYGYGRAVYVDHPNGKTTVYAHLERYAPKIDSLVTRKQYEQKTFSIELYFKKGEIPVKRGEVIAYSGNAGSSGGPHLHYEIRETATQRPEDPLLYQLKPEDKVRPQIQGLKVYPMGDHSIVEGQRSSVYLPVVFYEGRFHPKGKKIINAKGSIGIGVQVLDYLSDSWRKCGVSTIELFANAKRIYKSDITSFSFAETRYINSHIDYREKVKSGKVVQKSFIEPNNRLDIYEAGPEKGIIQVADTSSISIKYVIKDVSGNVSELAFTVNGKDYDEALIPNPKQDGEKILSYKSAFELDTAGVKVAIKPNSFYTDVPFYFEVDESYEGIGAPLYVIGSNKVPVHQSFKLKIKVPDLLATSVDKLCVAGVSRSGKAYYAGGVVEDGYLSTSVRSFGKYTLALDTIVPTIKLINVPSNKDYRNRKTIELRISDNFSGIKSYNCYLNDNWVLFEYDAKTNRLVGFTNKIPFKKGAKQKLKVKVVDNKGNEATEVYNVIF
ncbi:M23 family metallopeptidase [Marinilabiliaceae bacterium JC017]|nr:M23 family metallopeptidase [Marinilabiliaceae bacterium JC017]